MQLYLFKNVLRTSVFVRKSFFNTFRSTIPRKMGKLATSKVDTPEYHGLFTADLKLLVDLFKSNNYEIRIAGGAVRDLLMGITPQDIDFATTATPQEMKDMFTAAQIRMINMKGEKHGTITARINDSQNFEVTTLRIDTKTDGRHAEVEFTTDWQLDANRRDLTINAMFLDFDGNLYDYFEGKEDLMNRVVRFVGDPSQRIQEDYLRILRYFRFWGRIALEACSHDETALDAIKENAQGLSGISGERIWVEMKKIVVKNHVPAILDQMQQLEVLANIGFIGNVEMDRVQRVWKKCKDLSPQPMTVISSLLETENDLVALNNRVKMSNDEFKLSIFILEHRDVVPSGDALKYYQDLLISQKDSKLKGRILELLKYLGREDIYESFDKWVPPRFPVTGYHLMEMEVPKGPIFNKTLNSLKEIWKESNYTLNKEELLEKVQEIVKMESK